MSTRAWSPEDVCVFCGVTGKLTRDHLPPENLFPKPRPSDLVTVPSCRQCNGGASKDDEYFRMMLTMRWDTAEHPAASQVLPAVMRSLQKPHKEKMARAFIRNIFETNVQTSTGLYLGRAAGYQVDFERLSRVPMRTVRGLFYDEFKRPLRFDYEVTAWEVGRLDQLMDRASRQKLHAWCSALIAKPPKMIGGNVFWYWFDKISDDPDLTLWALVFYQRVVFVCMTGKQESPDQ